VPVSFVHKFAVFGVIKKGRKSVRIFSLFSRLLSFYLGHRLVGRIALFQAMKQRGKTIQLLRLSENKCDLITLRILELCKICLNVNKGF
jgi:hypothetical protein